MIQPFGAMKPNICVVRFYFFKLLAPPDFSWEDFQLFFVNRIDVVQ